MGTAQNWVSESWEEIQRRSPVTNVDGTWQQYYDQRTIAIGILIRKQIKALGKNRQDGEDPMFMMAGKKVEKKDGNFVPVLNLNMETHNRESHNIIKIKS